MRKSEQFLDTYALLEKHLRAEAKLDRCASFYQLVDRAAGAKSSVRRFKDDLKEYADLRNAIVHERSDGHVIAEPHERAVQGIARILEALTRPPKVIPMFQRRVVGRSLQDTIGSAVTDMRGGDFSQLPILNGENVVALLTSETVVRWLAAEVSNEIVSLWETKIEDVLPHVEDPDHYCLVAKTASLHDVVSSFEEFTSKGKDLAAVLVTEGGKPNQKLMGIVTVFDLPAILGALGIRRLTTA